MKLKQKELGSWQEDFLGHPEGSILGSAACRITQLNGKWSGRRSLSKERNSM